MSWMGVLQTGQFFWFFTHLVHETMCLQGCRSTSLSLVQQIQHRLLLILPLELIYCSYSVLYSLLSFYREILSTSYMAELPILKIIPSFRECSSLLLFSSESLCQDPLVEAISSNRNTLWIWLILQCRLLM